MHPDSEFSAASAIIEDIYATIPGESSWETVLQKSCRLLDATAGSIIFLDPLGQQATHAFEYGTNPQYSQKFRDCGSANPFMLSVLLSPVGEVAKPLDLVGRKGLVNERFHQEWCVPQGHGDFVGGLVARRERQFATLSFARPVDRPPFADREAGLLRLIVPHVVRSLAISDIFAGLQVQKNAYLESLDILRVPALLLAADARVVHANPVARDILRARDDIALNAGKLVFSDASIQAELWAVLASDLTATQTFMLGHPADTMVTLTPLASGSRRGKYLTQAVASIFFASAHTNLPPPAVPLVKAFGLTPAELRVLVLLLEGRNPGEIAQEIGIGITTIRSHIASLLAKTGSERQQDMIVKVMAMMPIVKN